MADAACSFLSFFLSFFLWAKPGPDALVIYRRTGGWYTGMRKSLTHAKLLCPSARRGIVSAELNRKSSMVGASRFSLFDLQKHRVCN